MRQYRLRHSELRTGIALALMLLASSALQAQIFLSLTPSDNDVRPGDRLQILGRLVNGTADTYFPTGGNGTITGGNGLDLTWDDLDFQNSLPTSLGPGDFYEGNLYLDVAPDAIENQFTAIYTVTADFGDPPSPLNISSSIRVTVVPSPASWTVMAGGFAGLWGVRRKRRQA